MLNLKQLISIEILNKNIWIVGGSMSDDEGVDVSSGGGGSVAGTAEQGAEQHANELAAVFREHLRGLFAVLLQLSDAADYLSKRYQDEVDQSMPGGQ